MNIIDKRVLKKIKQYGKISQRQLSEVCGFSLGKVNQSIQFLQKEEYIDEEWNLTEKSTKLIDLYKPKKAIILAAGLGMRMVPINTEVPKALLTVKGETLIERLIHQLHEVNVYDITVVVGFMKEEFEFLIDEYKVKLVCNMDYAKKNNLHSLAKVGSDLINTYIIPCDIWCETNPFNACELYSWYMVKNQETDNTSVRLNKKYELVKTKLNEVGDTMIGISYISLDDAGFVAKRIYSMSSQREYEHCFWEDVLYVKDKMIVSPYVFNDAYEINTYEQLRDLDEDNEILNSDLMNIIKDTIGCEISKIMNIQPLKKGMTNRSFSFEVNSKRYIMRVPGEGTEKLINRKHEYDVYQAIKDENICDPVIYMNPENGYKITEYIHNAHACDSTDFNDVSKCMNKLHAFHDKKLKVNHTFEVFEELEKYESYWQGIPSIYRDYKTTKAHIYELKEFVDAQPKKWGLSHIDSVPDNFLFSDDELYLIDWEYAGMQDQHIDIAMFAIYSLYDREDVEKLIDAYFNGQCKDLVRIKIYAYIAICGLLWSNWCEYKRNLGVEFGEYSLKQYRYAKEYYRIVKEALEERGMKLCTK
mgnify:FL=1